MGEDNGAAKGSRTGRCQGCNLRTVRIERLLAPARPRISSKKWSRIDAAKAILVSPGSLVTQFGRYLLHIELHGTAADGLIAASLPRR